MALGFPEKLKKKSEEGKEREKVWLSNAPSPEVNLASPKLETFYLT